MRALLLSLLRRRPARPMSFEEWSDIVVRRLYVSNLSREQLRSLYDVHYSPQDARAAARALERLTAAASPQGCMMDDISVPHVAAMEDCP